MERLGERTYYWEYTEMALWEFASEEKRFIALELCVGLHQTAAAEARK